MGSYDHTEEEEDDNTDFLQELIDQGHLSDVAAGVTRQVIGQGEESLSDKQKAVFEREVREPFLNHRCSRCDEMIPASELSGAMDNGWLCSWCSQVTGKDD